MLDILQKYVSRSDSATLVSRKAKILIADDSDSVRKQLKVILASHPEWEICGEAADGDEALRLARLHHPDAIILDVFMPGINGLQASAVIKREMPDVPIIIYAIDADIILEFRAHSAGASRIVSKLDDPKVLVEAIKSVIEKHESDGGFEKVKE